jgi:hypothetical protein
MWETRNLYKTVAEKSERGKHPSYIVVDGRTWESRI